MELVYCGRLPFARVNTLYLDQYKSLDVTWYKGKFIGVTERIPMNMQLTTADSMLPLASKFLQLWVEVSSKENYGIYSSFLLRLLYIQQCHTS